MPANSATIDRVEAGTMTVRGVAIGSLLAAVMLFALGPAILKLLMVKAAAIGLGEPNVLSFCNVLFVGNMCAGVVTFVVGGPRAILHELRGLAPRVKRYLAAAALLSTIYPALLYTALEQTSVINIVLLSRFNGIVYVALAFLLLRISVDRIELLSYSLMAVGVAIQIVVNNRGPEGMLAIRRGDLYVLCAALFFALTEIVSKKVLPGCSVATYIFVRNFFSSIVFFVAAGWLFGLGHFGEAFTGDLWVLMLVYAGVAIVAAQIFWLRAVKVVSVQTLANANLMNPAFSLLFAFFLLGEIPTLGQAVVLGIILAGMLVRVGGHRKAPTARLRPMQIEMGLVGH